MSFAPRLTALPSAQRAVWSDLRPLLPRFVLYGGTGLALRLGHRLSEDFDFFTDAPMDPEEVLGSVPLLNGAVVRQKSANTLTVSVHRPEPVKLSFFGLALHRVQEPERTDDGVVRTASLLDLAGCKMAVIQGRSEAKDYLDIHALLKHGLPLADMLGAAQAIYGAQFFALISLKALAFFEDGDLPGLPAETKEALKSAAGAVRQIPDMKPLPGGLVPPG